MATPPHVTMAHLNDQWGMKVGLCDDADPMLRMQGVPWFWRKIMSNISVPVALKTWDDENTGQPKFMIEYKPPLGLPTSTEERVLDFDSEEVTKPIFGKLRVRMRWATSNELDEISGFLAEGFEERKNVYMMTEHLDHGSETHQVFGFETIDGTRYHTRHILMKQGSEVAQLRLVYYYMGPRK